LAYGHKLALDHEMKAIELIVNQHNQRTIDIYLKNGFEIMESMVNAFPNGHSTEDYKMVRIIAG